MEKFLKKLDFLGSPFLKAIVAGLAVLVSIAVICLLYALAIIAIDFWAVVILIVLCYAALVTICYFGFKERERRKM